MCVYPFTFSFPGGKVRVEPDPDKLERWIKKIPDWIILPSIHGRDLDGRRATFEFYTLIGVNHNYGWKFNSSEMIQDNIKFQSIEAEKFLATKFSQAGIKQRLENAKDVISVGVASCEGFQRIEERRAEIRAKIIRRALEQTNINIKGELPLLMLGQYKDENCPKGSPQDTLEQRSIILIGVTNKEPGVNLDQSLRNAMNNIEKNTELKKDLENYLNSSNTSPLGSLLLKKYSLFKIQI
jgi:predicted lactoylglutathione lyase